MRSFSKGDRVVTRNGAGEVLRAESIPNLYAVRIDGGYEDKYWASNMKLEGAEKSKKKDKVVFKLRLKGTDCYYDPNNEVAIWKDGKPYDTNFPKGRQSGHYFRTRKQLDEFLFFIRKGCSCLAPDGSRTTVAPEDLEIVKFKIVEHAFVEC